MLVILTALLLNMKSKRTRESMKRETWRRTMLRIRAVRMIAIGTRGGLNIH